MPRRKSDRPKPGPLTGRKLRCEKLEDRTMLAGDLELVRDVNLALIPDGSSPNGFVDVNGTLFFVANDGVSGAELWKSDGTETGTLRLKDIRHGSSNANPRHLTNVGGTLYFSANDGVSGYELWKSDGTQAGTVRVKDIRAGSGQSTPSNLTNVGGTLYFRADDGVSGLELWKSDGTEAGTFRVKDIRTGLLGSYPRHFTSVGGTLYFTASDGLGGEPLWKSDGTEAGTVRLTDLQTSYYEPGGFSTSSLTNVDGTLYFHAVSAFDGFELWKSDGTEAGTSLVKDINLTFGNGSNPRLLTNVGGTLYFRANDGVSGVELWRSDGTEAGTARVEDVRTGPLSSNPRYLTNVGGTLYFQANDGLNGYQLWKTDGTEAGSVRMKAVLPISYDADPRNLMDIGGTLYFRGNDGASGVELWKSDGTEAGTVRIKDIRSGSPAADPKYLTNVGGMLYFRANDGVSGYELWKSDGAEAGTVRVKDIRTGSQNADPRYLTNVGGMLYYSANDGFNGRELWKSDGTGTGTVRVDDIRAGSFGSSPSSLTNLFGTLYFRANGGVSDYGLWSSDGTDAGTQLVKSFVPSVSSSLVSGPTRLTPYGSTFIFVANDGVAGAELWKSDGTEAGTIRVKDIRPGAGSAFYFHPNNLYPTFTEIGGTLYFRANDGVSGFELWKTDGTETGTVRVKDVRPGSRIGLNPFPFLTNVGGTLFFRGGNGVNGYELWKSDGTEAGTVFVKDTWPGSSPFANNSGPRHFANVGGTLFFTTNDGSSGYELWKSDGTETGTVRIKDAWVGSGPGYTTTPHDLVDFGGVLYYVAADATSGLELWRSDGTEAGTVRVKDIRPGAAGSFRMHESQLANVNGTLFFNANDGVNGYELWRSDGSEAGTVPVRLAGGVPLQNVKSFTKLHDRLFVAGTRPEYGAELFSLVLIDPPALAGDFDRSGLVDQADRDVWLADYGSGTRLRADGNGDGVVDLADYTVWRDNLGASLPAAVDAALEGLGAEGPGVEGLAAEGLAAQGWATEGRGTGEDDGVAPLLLAFSETPSVPAMFPWLTRKAPRPAFAAPQRDDLLLVPLATSAATDAALEALAATEPAAATDTTPAPLGQALRPGFTTPLRPSRWR